MEKKPKVAIVFFGLTRCLPDTIDEMKQYLFQPILDAGMEYDIFMHTYIINGHYQNRWSNEDVKNYDNEQYKLLDPKYFITDVQEDILKDIHLDDYYQNLNIYAIYKPQFNMIPIINYYYLLLQY